MEALKICVLLLLVSLIKAQSSFRLANIYQNDMVLQMEPKRATIWGYGESGYQINVKYEGITIGTPVTDGIWKVTLPAHAAGGPIYFEISHTNGVETGTIFLSAWFGDVWLCSGQSNMEMKIREVYNASEEANKAQNYKNIRLLQVANEFSLDQELDEVRSFSQGWSAPTIDNVREFSALCLMYGERLSESFNNQRPIGLIDATWGATRVEAWMSQRVSIYCLTPPNAETGFNSISALWNAMIAPLAKTSIRGAIWYQGEANVAWHANYYSCHLAAMVEDWKNTFQDAKVAADSGVAFPFGVVQIGTTEVGEDYNWGTLRLHQTIDQGVLPNALLPEGFFAAAYDLTDRNSTSGDIHPRDKQTVADRLANSAKSLLYGENFSQNGPTPISVSEDSPTLITITYDRKIKIVGTEGFSVQRADGTWSATSVFGSSDYSVSVSVDPDVILLTLGFRATVCEYKECVIYSDDAENLPAQVWQWDIAALRSQIIQALL